MVDTKAKLRARIGRACIAVVCLVVAWLIAWNAWMISRVWLTQPDIVAFSRAFPKVGDPIDIPLIFSGLRATPTFLDTFKWWHQTWAGTVPFWRPLTSQFFWLEYHLLTPDRFDRWQWVGIISHLIFTALLFLLGRRMTGKWWIGLLAAFLFAGPRFLWGVSWIFYYSNQGWDTPAAVALDAWKNQPEMWAGACIIGAMLAALSRRWILLLVCTAAAISFKENGWYTYLLVPLALYGAGAKMPPRRIVIAGFVMAIVFMALRASAGWAVFRGYQMGPEVTGPTRYFIAVQGYYIGLLRSPSAAPAILAACLMALILWRRPGPIIRGVLAAVSVVACIFLNAKLQLTTLDASVAQFLEWDLALGVLVLAFAWLLAAWLLLTSPTYRRPALAVVGMILVSALSMAAAVQVIRHALYLTYAFQALLTTLVVAAVAERLPALLRALRVIASPTKTALEAGPAPTDPTESQAG